MLEESSNSKENYNSYAYPDQNYSDYANPTQGYLPDSGSKDEQNLNKHLSTARPISVWAAAPDVPIFPCFDARLNGEDTKITYPNGTNLGQAGWDMGINYINLKDLADKLKRNPMEIPSHVCGKEECDRVLKKGQIYRLAINAHGNTGEIRINGKTKEAVTSANIDKFREDLHDVGLAVSEYGGTILLMNCVAGRGKEGSKLLKALSNIWTGRKVVGFITIGFAWGARMKRPGTGCTEAGMRATHSIASLEEREHRSNWNDLNILPWAWEHVKLQRTDRQGNDHMVPVAKIALNGSIIQLEGF